MSQEMEIVPNIHPNVFWVNIRTRGSQASICVRIFTQFTRRNMSKKILLLGITDSVLANAQQQLTLPDLEVFLGKSLEDVWSWFSLAPTYHVFIGRSIAMDTDL